MSVSIWIPRWERGGERIKEMFGTTPAAATLTHAEQALATWREAEGRKGAYTLTKLLDPSKKWMGKARARIAWNPKEIRWKKGKPISPEIKSNQSKEFVIDPYGQNTIDDIINSCDPRLSETHYVIVEMIPWNQPNNKTYRMTCIPYQETRKALEAWLLRHGSVLSLNTDVCKKYIQLLLDKNVSLRWVPLSGDAKQILEEVAQSKNMHVTCTPEGDEADKYWSIEQVHRDESS